MKTKLKWLLIAILTLYLNTIIIMGQESQNAKYGFDRTYQDSLYKGLINHFQIEIPKQMKEKGVVGVAVALTDEKGIIWAQGFGYTSNDEKYKVNEETLFSLQSVTKVFTVLSTLIAYQDGLI